MISRVYGVTRVDLDTTLAVDDTVPALKVSAEGQVNSGGWSDPELGPWSYITPPEDGILDIDFVATPPKPTDVVTMGFQKIEARGLFAVPAWVRGVRIHAATNAIERVVPSALPATAPVSISGDGVPVPWPFPWFRPQSAEIAGGAFLPLFETKLSFPQTIIVNLMPPVPDKVTVRATATVTVTNNSGRKEILTAATPCAIHHWEVEDSTGRIVDLEKDEFCLQIFQTRTFEPGETIRSDYVVSLNGKALVNGERYRLRFKFWGFVAEASFDVQVVH